MISLLLFVCGAALGSFAGVLVWRIRKGRGFVRGRSECEHCHRQLRVLELIPVIGWVIFKGKCRYCHKPVPWEYPVMEFCLGTLFTLSYLFWPLGFNEWQAIMSFGIWLLYLVILAALFLYDVKWMILPDKLVYPIIGLALIDALLRVSLQSQSLLSGYLFHVLGGIVVIAGFYWVLHTASKGKLVGYGDVKLSVFIGAVLGWQHALLVLALSNVIAMLIVAPGLALGKLTRKSKVPFGPFLIAAFILVGLAGGYILDWYISLVMSSAGF